MIKFLIPCFFLFANTSWANKDCIRLEAISKLMGLSEDKFRSLLGRFPEYNGVVEKQTLQLVSWADGYGGVGMRGLYETLSKHPKLSKDGQGESRLKTASKHIPGVDLNMEERVDFLKAATFLTEQQFIEFLDSFPDSKPHIQLNFSLSARQISFLQWFDTLGRPNIEKLSEALKTLD